MKQFQETIHNIKTDREMGELGDLKFLFKLAAKTDSIQNFVEEAEKYLQSKEKKE